MGLPVNHQCSPLAFHSDRSPKLKVYGLNDLGDRHASLTVELWMNSFTMAVTVTIKLDLISLLCRERPFHIYCRLERTQLLWKERWKICSENTLWPTCNKENKTFTTNIIINHVYPQWLLMVWPRRFKRFDKLISPAMVLWLAGWLAGIWLALILCIKSRAVRSCACNWKHSNFF